MYFDAIQYGFMQSDTHCSDRLLAKCSDNIQVHAVESSRRRMTIIFIFLGLIACVRKTNEGMP